MQIIFLDCSDEELLLRYRFTRRQHPMISNKMATTLEEAIEIERDFLIITRKCQEHDSY